MRHVAISAQVESSMAQIMQDLHNIRPGRLRPGDPLLAPGDGVCGTLNLQGVFELDDEDLCHQQLVPFACEVPGCGHFSSSLLEAEQHYGSRHRYECAQCRKHLATSHLLDLHLCESHDSFFALQAQKTPSYLCFMEDCGEKFQGPKERLAHCVEVHQFPKDFRYDQSQAKNLSSGSVDRGPRQGQSVAQARGRGRPMRGRPSQHLLGSRGRGRGGSLDWYQRVVPRIAHEQQEEQDLAMDMQDLEDSLPVLK